MHRRRCDLEALDPAAGRQLSRYEEGFGVFAFPAEFERAEVFEPRSLGYFGFCFDPEAELIEILHTDLPVVHALDQMLSQRDGKSRPSLDLRHLLPEDEAAHFIA